MGQGLVVLCSPLLTRMYAPADFGVLVVFTSIATILGAVCTLRLEAAIPLPRRDVHAGWIAWTAIGIAIVSTTMLLTVGALAARPISIALGAPELSRFWWLVSLTVLAIGVGQVFAAWMVRGQHYMSLGRRNIATGVGQVFVQLSLGALGWTPIGLLLGLLGGRVSSIGVGVATTNLIRQRRPRRREAVRVLGRYRCFPLIASWSALLNTVGSQAPLLLISACYGQVAAGLIGLTARVLAAPVAIVGQSVAHVYLGEASVVNRIGTPELRPLVQRIVFQLGLMGLLPALVLAGFGPQLFELVFGGEWSASGYYAQWLSIGYLAEFAVAPISHTLPLLERQGVQFAWDLLRLCLTLGSPMVCFALRLPIDAAVAALSASYVISYGILFFYCSLAAAKADGRMLTQKEEKC
ncbi:lipopolysaccharide biosynthesis protein [Saccharopolyspora shandongensis]|uniref:lipopolysaccharide biosynthesis protein n=1 Tax=Saccharopolyspora shandongensis TaxID=418495 RepID=UPI0033E823C6